MMTAVDAIKKVKTELKDHGFNDDQIKSVSTNTICLFALLSMMEELIQVVSSQGSKLISSAPQE